MTTVSRRERWGTWHSKFIVEERYVEPGVRRRLYAGATSLIIIGLAAFFFLLVSVLTHSGFELLDRPVENWFDAQRSASATGVMIALAIVVLVVLVVWIIAARHLWRPALLFGGMVTGVVLAELLGPIVKHPRPPIGLMLFGPDRTFSFPSGHVLGTSDFLLIVAFLLASRIQRTWFTVLAVALALVGIAAQFVSRLYLGYHWISDTTASIAISMVIVGTLILVDTRRTVRTPGERVRGELSQPQEDGT
jgi:membrane-associated phospholipid phosphatase